MTAFAAVAMFLGYSAAMAILRAWLITHGHMTISLRRKPQPPKPPRKDTP